MHREIPELWTDQMETFLGKKENPFMGKKITYIKVAEEVHGKARHRKD
jgi:hypothetical protein